MKGSIQTKPSIMFCHGIWADGSCFNKVIPTLHADGHQVIAAQCGLDTFGGDVATAKRTMGRVNSPAILVRHSYDGSVITAAGTDDRVAALFYIAALAPDAGETSQSQRAKSPVADVFSHIEVADASGFCRMVSSASRATCLTRRRRSSGQLTAPLCEVRTRQQGVQLRALQSMN